MKRALPFPLLLAVAACQPPSAPGVPPEEEVAREWVDIIARPCAVDNYGDVQCWNSSGWPVDSYTRRDRFVPEHMDGYNIKDLYLEYRSRVLKGLSFTNEETTLYCDMPDPFHCLNIKGPVKEAGPVFGLRFDGSLTIEAGWSLDVVFDAADTWLTIARTDNIAINARHEAVMPFRDVDRSIAGPQVFPLILAGQPKTVVGYTLLANSRETGGCVLDDTGEIVCFGGEYWQNNPFDDPPYRWLDGGAMTACAVRERDHQITCLDGTTHNWGRLKAFAAYNYDMYWIETDGSEGYAPRDVPSICAITALNEIKCAGPGYHADIQEQLAITNDENRRYPAGF